MTYPSTKRQQEAKDEHRERIHDLVVPKALRARALEISYTITDPERRTHAFTWIKGRSRVRAELESFIERMTPQTEGTEEQ